MSCRLVAFLRSSFFLAWLTIMLPSIGQGQARGASLLIQVPGAGQDLVGYTFSYDGEDFVWFLVPDGREVVVPNLTGGTYKVKMLCPQGGLNRGRSLDVSVEPGSRGNAVFRVPYHFGPQTVEFSFGPGQVGKVYLNGCMLQEELLRAFDAKTKSIATVDEVLDFVGGIDKSKTPRDASIIDPKTATENFLAEVSYVESENLQAAAKRQVERLLKDKVELWTNGRGQFIGKEYLRDPTDRQSNQTFLGVLVAAADHPQIGVGESSIIQVHYLSAEQSLSSRQSKTSYELELKQEPEIKESDDHVKVIALHQQSSQEIAPRMTPGVWQYELKAEQGFKGCVFKLRYVLWKKVAGRKPQMVVPDGTFPGILRVDAKAIPIPRKPDPPTILGTFVKWAKEYRDWSAWALVCILSSLQITQIAIWFRRRAKLESSHLSEQKIAER